MTDLDSENENESGGALPEDRVDLDASFFFTTDGLRNFTLFRRVRAKYGANKRKLAEGEGRERAQFCGYASSLADVARLYAQRASLNDLDGIASVAALERRLAAIETAIRDLAKALDEARGSQR